MQEHICHTHTVFVHLPYTLNLPRFFFFVIHQILYGDISSSTYFISVKGVRLKFFLIQHSVPTLHRVHGNHISGPTTFLTLIPSISPLQPVALREMYLGGLTADNPAACNKGCQVRPQSQRQIGKLGGPTLRQSGAGRNL